MAPLCLALPRRWLAAPAGLETAVLKFTILRDGKLGRVAIPDVHGVALLYLRQGAHQARVGRVQEHDPLLLQRHPNRVRAAACPGLAGLWAEAAGPAFPGDMGCLPLSVFLCHGLLVSLREFFARRIRVTAGN